MSARAEVPVTLWRLAVALVLLAPVSRASSPPPLPKPRLAPYDREAALAAIAPGLSREVLSAGLRAWERVRAEGRSTSSTLALIDYSRPSTQKRLWVFDVGAAKLLMHELVTHGRGSGALHASHFSNTAESHRSSMGVFVGGERYRGKHGDSLRLEGLEPGFNDNARSRAIVIHGADYATPEFAERNGRLGLSWGCPAVAPKLVAPLIEALETGGVLLAWYPDERWLSASAYVR